MRAEFALNLIMLFSSYIYAGVFILLVLSGCGFPLPEELTLLAAGFITSQLIANYFVMLMFSYLALFISDMIPYLLGRFYGTRVFGLKYVKAVISVQKSRKISKFFRLHGYKRVFLMRPALIGIRPLVMMFAGASGLRMKSFMLYNMAGELISVVFWVSIGRIFATHLAELGMVFYHGKNIIIAAFAVAVLLFAANKFYLKIRISVSLMVKVATVIFSLAFLSLIGYEAYYYRNSIRSLIVHRERVIMKIKPAVKDAITDVLDKDEAPGEK